MLLKLSHGSELDGDMTPSDFLQNLSQLRFVTGFTTVQTDRDARDFLVASTAARSVESFPAEWMQEPQVLASIVASRVSRKNRSKSLRMPDRQSCEPK